MIFHSQNKSVKITINKRPTISVMPNRNPLSPHVWRLLIKIWVLFFLLGIIHPCIAAVSTEKIKDLGVKLTPLGAQHKGNSSGSIPAWESDKQKADKISAILTTDKPLFVVTSKNAHQYAERLTPGQKALFTVYPDTFKMPVYASRRLHNVPKYQYVAARKNALETELIDNGNGITNAWPGLPFPIPQSSLEVLWNHLLSWKGLHLKANIIEAAIHSNGSVAIIKNAMELAMPYYVPDREKISGNSVFLYYLSRTLSPARLSGGATLTYESTNPRLYPRKKLDLCHWSAACSTSSSHGIRHTQYEL